MTRGDCPAQRLKQRRISAWVAGVAPGSRPRIFRGCVVRASCLAAAKKRLSGLAGALMGWCCP